MLRNADIDIGIITSDDSKDSLIGRKKGVNPIGYDGCHGKIYQVFCSKKINYWFLL